MILVQLRVFSLFLGCGKVLYLASPEGSAGLSGVHWEGSEAGREWRVGEEKYSFRESRGGGGGPMGESVCMGTSLHGIGGGGGPWLVGNGGGGGPLQFGRGGGGGAKDWFGIGGGGGVELFGIGGGGGGENEEFGNGGGGGGGIKFGIGGGGGGGGAIIDIGDGIEVSVHDVKSSSQVWIAISEVLISRVFVEVVLTERHPVIPGMFSVAVVSILLPTSSQVPANELDVAGKMFSPVSDSTSSEVWVPVVRPVLLAMFHRRPPRARGVWELALRASVGNFPNLLCAQWREPSRARDVTSSSKPHIKSLQHGQSWIRYTKYKLIIAVSLSYLTFYSHNFF